MASASTITLSKTEGRVAVLEFDAAHEFNPFSMNRMRELQDLVRLLDADDEVGAIVLYGGEGRSFAAGGDFNETSEFEGGTDVDEWIDHITDLYTELVRGKKPIVSAIDGFCVGLGLQIAICGDYRIASERATLIMPELKLGIACTFGGYMLEALIGRSAMQSMVFSADPWPADVSLAHGLVHEVVDASAVRDRAIERAEAMASWTAAAVHGTRPQINEAFAEGLERCRVAGKSAHRSAFSAGEAQERMKAVLRKSNA